MKAEDLAKVNALRQKKAPDPNTITISRTKSKQDIEREAKHHAELKASIEALAEVMEVKLKFPDIEPLIDRLETLHDLPDSFSDIKNMSLAVSNKMERLLNYFDNKKKPEFRIQGFRNLWEMIIDQNTKSDEVSKQLNTQVITKFADLRTYIEQLTETIKQGQSPDDYKPVRIVVGGDGVPLAFLKQFPVARGGGGGTSGSSSGVVTIDGQPIDINISSSDVAMGGGTQYTEGDTDATITGTALMWEDGSNTLRAVSAAKPLPVDIQDASVVIESVNLDIRDLTSASDSISSVVTSSALPTGAATSAKQDTLIGHVDGLEGLLGTIDTDTGTLAGAVSGSEVQVDIVSAPTLTVNAHAVTNAGTFAVQVDGAALTALQLLDDVIYVDDADWTDNTSKHASVGGVYQSSPHTVTDGDVTPFLTDANGRLAVSGTIAVTQSGTWDEVGINDSGNSITVDGTITANLSATDNAVLDSIDTSTQGILADTAAIQTAVEVIDNAISGSEMQVDVVAALPAGSNAIGKLAANSGVDIGDVDVLSVAGTVATKETQPATPTLANVTMTGSSVTVQASNTARRNLMIFNDSGVVVYVKLGTTASATSFTVKMVDQSYYELPTPVYTGIVTALGASGDVRVTEIA